MGEKSVGLEGTHWGGWGFGLEAVGATRYLVSVCARV